MKRKGNGERDEEKGNLFSEISEGEERENQFKNEREEDEREIIFSNWIRMMRKRKIREG